MLLKKSRIINLLFFVCSIFCLSEDKVCLEFKNKCLYRFIYRSYNEKDMLLYMKHMDSFHGGSLIFVMFGKEFKNEFIVVDLNNITK